MKRKKESKKMIKKKCQRKDVACGRKEKLGLFLNQIGGFFFYFSFF